MSIFPFEGAFSLWLSLSKQVSRCTFTQENMKNYKEMAKNLTKSKVK